jgi:hypothetical protein
MQLKPTNLMECMDNIKSEFARRLAERIEQMDNITPETLSDMLIQSGIVTERRILQYCAICEFYDSIGSKTKTQTIKELSAKYNISERILVELTGRERRFLV